MITNYRAALPMLLGLCIIAPPIMDDFPPVGLIIRRSDGFVLAGWALWTTVVEHAPLRGSGLPPNVVARAYPKVLGNHQYARANPAPRILVHIRKVFFRLYNIPSEVGRLTPRIWPPNR